jgi:phage FluMu protein Com
MDLTFNCEKCKQQLAVDVSAAGSEIECPTCGQTLTVPQADPTNIHVSNPISSSAAARVEKHFSVPVHDAPSEILIKKIEHQPEVSPGGKKTLKIKCIKRVDCVEVGKDRYEEIVSNFLGKLG